MYGVVGRVVYSDVVGVGYKFVVDEMVGRYVDGLGVEFGYEIGGC